MPLEKQFSPDYSWGWNLGPGPQGWVTTTTTNPLYLVRERAMKEPKLVYIDPDAPVAYFSQASDPWGDDWNDAPYEHNSGKPYDWTVRVVYLDTDLETPCANTMNSNYSVEHINRGMTPWLRSPLWSSVIIAIPAGVTVKEFIDKIHAADGIAIIVPEKEVPDDEE